MFLCHFGVASCDKMMQVCLQLMMKHVNNLALDQLTTLARSLSHLDSTRQTRLLSELTAVLCSSRGDQLAALSVEHKIYLLEEFGSRLSYSSDLLESLWDDRRDLYKWQQAGALFIALARARKPSSDSDQVPLAPPRHECLEEWCMDILCQQYKWLNADSMEALLAALIMLGVYDGQLLRLLGDHIQTCSADLVSRLSVWHLLADGDFLHVGLMEAILTELRTSDIEQMSTDTQLSLVEFLAEAANYYHSTSSQEMSSSSHQPDAFDDGLSARVDDLCHALHMPTTIPTGNSFNVICGISAKAVNKTSVYAQYLVTLLSCVVKYTHIQGVPKKTAQSFALISLYR